MAARIALLFVPLFLDACTHACSAVGCDSAAATIEATITTPPAQLENGLLRVCRNDLCTESEIKLDSGQLILAEPRRNQLSMQLGGHSLDPHMVLVVPSYNPIELADGDEYSVELVSPAGTVEPGGHGSRGLALGRRLHRVVSERARLRRLRVPGRGAELNRRPPRSADHRASSAARAAHSPA